MSQESSVRVLEDTKAALNELKYKMKVRSLDAVIQRLIKERKA